MPGAAPAPAPPPMPGEPPAPPAAPSASPAEDPALLHSTEQSRTYPCRACGGELEFDIERQLLRCAHCGSEEQIDDDPTRIPVERDLHAAIAELRSGQAARAANQVEGEKEIVCQNCGGHTTFTGSLTSSRCPYCATPIQRDDVHDAPTRLPVDGILPFQVDDDSATKAIKDWINSRWFAPNEFKKYSRTGSFTSVYMAYFTYDAHATTRYTGQRGDNYTVTVGSGENRRTETRTEWTRVSGTVTNAFDDVAVHANDGLEHKHVEALEPWPTGQARPFSPQYVAGHLARTYDRDVEQCFEVAEDRMEDVIRSTVKRDIGGDQQRISSMNISWSGLAYKHLLLPIWLLTVIFQQRPFQVMINGVTGEVQGQRPYSKVKIALAVIAALIVVGVIVAVVMAGGSSEGT